MKNILLIEHGGRFKKFTIQKLVEDNFRVYIACTKKPDWLDGIIREDQYIITDTYNSTVLLESVLAYISINRIALDGVGTFWESCVVQTADIAEALSLPGIGSGPARRSSQNKLLMRMRCSEKGISSPRFSVANLHDSQSIQIAAQSVGYPFVIKPIYGSSSYGVVKVSSPDELVESVVKSRASISEDAEEIFKLFDGFVLIEQYLSGTLLSVDGVVQDNQVQFAGITEFIMGPEPYFTQIGSIVGPQPEEVERQLFSYTQRIIDVLGFKDGAFHCEVRFENGTPVLVEIAARMPGGPIALGYEEAFGIDFVGTLGKIWTGEAAKLNRNKSGYSMHKCVFPSVNSTVKLHSVDGYETVYELPGVWDFIPISKSGSTLHTYPEIPDPVYYYAVKADTSKDLHCAADGVEKHITFNTKAI